MSVESIRSNSINKIILNVVESYIEWYKDITFDILKNYSASDTRYTHSWKKIDMNYVPSKMSIYSLAKAIWYWNLSLEKDKIYRSVFLLRISNIIKSHFKNFTEEDINCFVRILYLNLSSFTSHLIDKKWDDYFLSNNDESEEIDVFNTNIALFNKVLDQTIYWLSKNKLETINDFKFAEMIRINPNRFKEAEKKYKPQLLKFAYWKRVTRKEPDDMYQEGLLVLWNVIKKYEWKNFAKLSTMFQVSLKNKYTDLVRYWLRHKRVINTFAENYSPIENDSKTSQDIDRLTHTEWKNDESCLETNEDNIAIHGFSDFAKLYLYDNSEKSKFHCNNSRTNCFGAYNWDDDTPF